VHPTLCGRAALERSGMVAPLLKQVFSPRTGACLDQEGLGMTVYEARAVVVEADTQAMVQIGPALSRWV